MYLDRMDYHENYDNNVHTYTFKGPCIDCKEKRAITVVGPDLFAFRNGENIQEAFPYLTSGDREFLISGTCDKCWDKMFGEEDDDKDPNRLLKIWKLDE